MSTAVLLNHEDPAFAFHHAMAHRNNFAVMYPLNRFSVMPYLIDPELFTDRNASSWHLNHQQSHNDALNTLQPFVGATRDGLFEGANLADTNLTDAEKLSWWKHQNHMEHYILETALLPDPRFQYPFW